MRKPSQKSIDLYNRLIAEQNKARKQLSRIHKRAEETLGTGRLPALIIPRRARKIRSNQFEGLSAKELHRRLKQYWSNLASLKEQFSRGLTSYLAKTVKEGYMALWRDQILDFSGEKPDVFGYTDKEGNYHGRLFSKEQIENSEYGEFMKTYNRLFMLSPETFLAMLYTGRMLAFKFIYEEMKNVRDSYSGSWLQEQNELLNLNDKSIGSKTGEEWLASMSGPKKQSKIVKEASEQSEEESLSKAYKSGKHGRKYVSKYK